MQRLGAPAHYLFLVDNVILHLQCKVEYFSVL